MGFETYVISLLRIMFSLVGCIVAFFIIKKYIGELMESLFSDRTHSKIVVKLLSIYLVVYTLSILLSDISSILSFMSSYILTIQSMLSIINAMFNYINLLLVVIVIGLILTSIWKPK
jgi:hypothetical protein